jgi:Ca2+-binding EF-hand superfamily protein
MISHETNQLFIQIFVTVLQHENSLEIIRQVLTENPNFEPFTVFKRFDKNNQNYVDENNIIDFLNKYQKRCTQSQIKQLISFYDSDLDGILSFFE